jgi:Ca2+-binding RTX toxin-like protein
MPGTGPIRHSLAAAVAKLLGKKVTRLLTIATMTGYGLIGFAQPASAAIIPTLNALDIANAMAVAPGIVTAATFTSTTASPPAPTPANATADSPLGGFPRNGATFGLLTTGNPTLADDPNAAGNTGQSNSGTAVRGDTDRDVTVMKIDFNVGATQNCVQFDFKFFSEEFPEFVGSPFNDAFIAEIDVSTWDTVGSEITAPDNIAPDPFGDVVSINASGPTSVSTGAAAGTTYDAATNVLGARSPITPGAHALYLSIFDQGDNIYDSAVFLDNLRLTTEAPGNCDPGTVFICTQTGTPGNDKLTGTIDNDVLCGLGGNDTLVGLGGNDVLVGSAGNDFLSPGNGNDLVLGELGADDTVSFEGSPGPVTANLGSGTADGAQGIDELVGVENARGTNSGDTLKGSGAKNELKGLKGSDKLVGQRKSDRLIGGAGNDRLDGGPGDDYCLQGPGNGRIVNCESGTQVAAAGNGGGGGGEPSCTAGYSPCIPPGSDVDCAGGSGNGPRYVEGPVTVTGSDPYGLDADGDGVGCE